MIETVIARYGRLDVLLNSAALTTPAVMDSDLSVTDISFETWNAVFNVNVTGYLLACKFAVPHMIAGGGGSIINISSGSGLVGDIVRTAYGVSKAAVISLTKHVATQYGQQGIRCNAIAPGIILTAATELAVPELVAIIRRHVLLPRLGVADDIASLVTFLASEESANITGQTICCDGAAWSTSRNMQTCWSLPPADRTPAAAVTWSATAPQWGGNLPGCPTCAAWR